MAIDTGLIVESSEEKLLKSGTPSVALGTQEKLHEALNIDKEIHEATIKSFFIGNGCNGKSNRVCKIEVNFEKNGRVFSQPFFIIISPYQGTEKEFDEILKTLAEIIGHDLEDLKMISYNLDRKLAAKIDECEPMPPLRVRFTRNPDNSIGNIGHAIEEKWLFPNNHTV